MSVRPPAVAGTFYPASPSELKSQVEGFLQGSGPVSVPKGVIAPHAGYVYSGPIAGSAFRRLAPAASAIRRVILLGPSHFVPIRGLALPDRQRFETPLGQVTV
ncbi:MAG TPA: AmmeMemoRadiSam system protein B, partial [Thermoanaerobaculia bacterium]|nr:AmmeMemoRadiSam system protein B [Thermoanaerobaculia bacterium]